MLPCLEGFTWFGLVVYCGTLDLGKARWLEEVEHGRTTMVLFCLRLRGCSPCNCFMVIGGIRWVPTRWLLGIVSHASGALED